MNRQSNSLSVFGEEDCPRLLIAANAPLDEFDFLIP
jgi:hypothetical protein